MTDFYDRLEARTPAARQAALFRDLRHVLTVAKPRTPALRAQLKGIKIADIVGPSDLRAIPLRRGADLLEAQREAAPFGGFAAMRASAAAQCFVAPDELVSLSGQAKDWFGFARALHAAGAKKGELILNCFAYDLDPRGHMVEAGARALGCPVLPAGSAPPDLVVAAATRLKPGLVCGPADRIKTLLDRAVDLGSELPFLSKAVVAGRLSAGLRSEFALRGIAVRLVHLSAEMGLIAFETGDGTGLVLNEGLILEILPPEPGESDGEMILTRINADYPLLRFATGHTTALLHGPAPCGRTNLVIRPPCEVRVSRSAVHAAHLAEIARRHPELGRMRLILRRPRDRDEHHLEVEHGGSIVAEAAIMRALAETLQRVTSLPGTIAFVKPGSLPDDEVAFVDERPSP